MADNGIHTLSPVEVFKEEFQEYPFLENIAMKINTGMFSSETKSYRLVIFTPKKIIFFTELPDDASSDTIRCTLQSALNTLATKFTAFPNQFVACGVNSASSFMFNPYNNSTRLFEQTEDGMKAMLSYARELCSHGPETFDHAKLSEMQQTLLFTDKPDRPPQEKIRVAEDGKIHLYKHGTWYEASEADTESVFSKCALSGMFGTHKFALGQKGRGLLYFFTLGLMGVGWFFDSLAMLLGFYRDPDGRYLLPLEDKRRGLLMMLVGAVVFVVTLLIVYFLFGLFSRILMPH